MSSMQKKEKAFLFSGCTSAGEFNFSPLHSAVIYHPWRSGPGPQELKRKCNRKRRRWTVWSPACKSSFFYEARPPWKMKCSCCERKQWSSTHVITLTPRRGSAGIHSRATAPMCPLGLKHHQLPPSPWKSLKVILLTSHTLTPYPLFFTAPCLPHNRSASIGYLQHL